MFYLSGISLIFYLTQIITLSDAVNMKIDGMIDLGPNWGYEYRIVGPDQNGHDRAKHAVSRHGIHHVRDFKLKEEKDERDRRDEENWKEVERRREAEKRKEEVKRKGEDKRKEINRKMHHKHLRQSDVIKTTEQTSKHHHTHTTSKPTRKKTTKDLETSESPRYAQVTFSSQSEQDSSALDSSEERTSLKVTMFDTYDFTPTRKPRKKTTTEVKKEISTHTEAKTEPTVEDIANDHRNKNLDVHSSKIPIKREQVGSDVDLEPEDVEDDPTTLAISTTSQITTIRTDELFSDPHKVRDDANINDFINQIYKQTLHVFDVIKQKTNEYHMKREVDVIARSYEDKFREFLSGTRNQDIKTRLGSQKVILNTIDMSNRILKRLINYMIGDMDKKGVLRNNVATANIFQIEVDKEMNLELNNACERFGICRTGSGFPDFFTEILTTTLRSDNTKFQNIFDSLTEALKNVDYNHVLPPRTEKRLLESIDDIEKLQISTLRPMFMIVKNIINNKNRPLIVNSFEGGRRVNSTLAILEMIDLLDENLPPTEENQVEWNNITTSLSDFSLGKRFDVQKIMESFVTLLEKSLKSMDADCRMMIAKNMDIILE